MSVSMPKVVELLAPAGDWECARAAVENGADAIYFGLDRFNARMRAENFTVAGLPDLMSYLHGRGVRGYVTFNILVFADELEAAEDYLRAIIEAGVDAAIVQDVGICRLIRGISTDFPIYASTQMSVTSAAGLAFAEELGCSLVALARECSVSEIEQIQAERATAAGTDPEGHPGSKAPFPLEVFVHGALCVAYSGQCLTSESLGGRSANRGECAQACRLPYELVCDGQTVSLGDRRYLLSPQDLAGLSVVPDLVRAGVTSLKIEGRLKSPEYVANITRIYRHVLDECLSQPEGKMPKDRLRRLVEDSRYAMEMAFSRGLYTGWLQGIDNQKLVHGRFGKKRGVYLGEVLRVQGESVFIKLAASLKPGDGVVFDAGQPDLPEQGGRVYSVKNRGPDSVLGFGRGDIRFDRIQPGNRVWKTDDPALDRDLRRSFTGDRPRFTRPVSVQVHGRAGESLRAILKDELGHQAEGLSTLPLVPARNRPLTTSQLEEQFGRLGGSSFHLATLDNFLEGDVILPLAELNRLRRDLVKNLELARRNPNRWQLQATPPDCKSTVEHMLSTMSDSPGPEGAGRAPAEESPGSFSGAIPSELIVLVRTLDQLDAVLETGINTVYAEFEDPRKYGEAVRRTRTTSAAWSSGQAVRETGPSVRQLRRSLWVAAPRISKPGENWILEQVLASNADGYLIRNYDHLQFFKHHRRIGDYTLNISNPLSASYFVKKQGLERVTASYDLNGEQLLALLRRAPPSWFEVTLHQHMPLFHMEHCVFCAFLSKGTYYTNCGRPCEKHSVRLRDRVQAEHPIQADAGCRNTVFNARAQTGAEHVASLLSAGLRHFRLEFLDESPDQVREVIDRYQQLFVGSLTGAQLWKRLNLASQLGVTRGTLEQTRQRSIMPQ
ncbi:MAG TPA: DUF3656 domain-containing protein [Candidatus Paceibacterota bacterium]|nr:DUF3656 domain-containing protein [Verrucomicrobiota bacterium]HRY47142.1 DUF3656 domain-containing protein [Candidatus Paceibacterota bacterium]